jgi:phenylalanyl-tRNA synthetase beta chain
MKFSANWLGEFVELPASSLADLLTMSGIEIEAIVKRGADFDKVIVGQITESKQHPNADRLSVCTVDDDSGASRQIVCGATNYKAGDKVLLALAGAELPGGLRIRASKIRGVESEGMLCSAKELGLGEDEGGLLILSDEATIGARVIELFPADVVFDVEITPNRGDLLSHFGLAREIASLTGKSLHAVAGGTDSVPSGAGDDAEVVHPIKISAENECPFYSVRRIDNVRVAPGPNWLRAKIESVGIRSINNIVDISNFVMLELGQPTHAFDAGKLRGEINVRLARDGEEFLALDGRTYSLTSENLVIADAERAIGIGGVMGGEESGVSETTTTVLLESAYFLPSSIRRTARQLNLPSDASYRFERGVDPQMILHASQRATELICEIAGGRAAEINFAGELPANPSDVSLSYERLDGLLGAHVEPAKADAILTRFGLEKGKGSSLGGSWKIPSYRRDLQRDVDLIEEIGRAYGIEKIPTADRSRLMPFSEADREYDFETQLRRRLVALGLSEARTPALISRNELTKTEGAIPLRNPLSEDHVALRTSLIPGLLGTLARNVRAGAESIAFFEIGSVFAAPAGEQKRMLALGMNGQVASAKNWREKNRRFDFFDLKGVIESILSAFEESDSDDAAAEFRRTQQRAFVLAAEIFHRERRVGICGQLTAAEAGALDASGAVLLAEMNLVEIAKARHSRATFNEIDRYPAIRRDIAMFAAGDVAHEQIMRAIALAKEPLLERVELFDLFSEKEAENAKGARKSLAYSLTYRDKSRTLTNEEVNAAHARIRERLRREVGAELRE